MRKIPGDLHDWLKEFSAAVRRRDVAAGKNLFASHFVAFGTLAVRVNRLDDLVARQWQAVHTHFFINPESNHDPVLRHA